jgi:3-methyladenine DNA glycosylase AlkD
MVTAEEVLNKLKEKADPDQLAGMARYGLTVEKRLGVSVPEMRKMAKQIGKDHQLALELWETGVSEAMIVASMVGVPEELTEAQMDAWVLDFNSWDVCDQVCMNLFEKSPHAWKKIVEWSRREEEFVKRAGFALLACLAWHDKDAIDEEFIKLLPVIEEGATDRRNFVKKAVSWALRNIGKRNIHLHRVAMKTVERLQNTDSKTANWIAKQAIRDLTSDVTKRRLKKEQT